MAIESLYPVVQPSLDLNFAAGDFDPRITFARASGATYYDGRTTAKAEENLVKYSQEFGNAVWSSSGTAVTSNTAAAPDGSFTADMLSEDTSEYGHYIFQPNFPFVAGLTYTQSVYAKAGTATVVQLPMTFAAFGSAVYANYDLSNGTIVFAGSGAFAQIVSVGGGWYRLSITATATKTSTLGGGGGVVLCNNNPSAASFPSYPATGKHLFLWGAQLELRATAAAYAPTTSAPITNYIPVLQTAPANVPRIDYDPVTGECKGLLIEEQRTNLLTYSERFGDPYWTKSGSSIVVDAAVAPDGTLTGDRLTEGTATGQHYVNSVISSTQLTTYTSSVYLKGSGRSWAYVTAGSQYTGVYVNLDDGILGSVVLPGAPAVASVTSVGNGWHRVSMTYESNGSSGLMVMPALMDGVKSYTGNGYSGIYIWGAQMEVGAFPTSYIRTFSQQVTRVADSASMTGANFSSWYRQDEGSLLVSYNTGPAAKDSRQVAISADGGVSNLIQLGLSSASVVFCEGISNGSTQFNFTQAVAIPNTVMNAAVGYANNSAFGSYLGSSAITDTNCIPPYGVNRLDIGNRGGGSQANTSIRRLTYYPKRLTNAQLQALTA